MSTTKTSKVKQALPPIIRPVNEDEFFEKKAARMKELLERYPVPEHIFKKK
jgi:hypothetical protein